MSHCGVCGLLERLDTAEFFYRHFRERAVRAELRVLDLEAKQRPLAVAREEATKAERERCIAVLERFGCLNVRTALAPEKKP